MISFYLLTIHLAWAVTSPATGLRERTLRIVPTASAHLAASADQLEDSIRRLTLGHSWAMSTQFKVDFARFVFNLKRQSITAHDRARVMHEFATFCRAEIPSAVPSIASALSSVSSHEIEVERARDLDGVPLRWQPWDVPRGAVQAVIGVPLLGLSIAVIPLRLLAPILAALSETAFYAPADQSDLDLILKWVLGNFEITTGGVRRMTGVVSARTLFRVVHPKRSLIRATCRSLLAPE